MLGVVPGVIGAGGSCTSMTVVIKSIVGEGLVEVAGIVGVFFFCV